MMAATSASLIPTELFNIRLLEDRQFKIQSFKKVESLVYFD